MGGVTSGRFLRVGRVIRGQRLYANNRWASSTRRRLRRVAGIRYLLIHDASENLDIWLHGVRDGVEWEDAIDCCRDDEFVARDNGLNEVPLVIRCKLVEMMKR